MKNKRINKIRKDEINKIKENKINKYIILKKFNAFSIFIALLFYPIFAFVGLFVIFFNLIRYLIKFICVAFFAITPILNSIFVNLEDMNIDISFSFFDSFFDNLNYDFLKEEYEVRIEEGIKNEK